jgi:aminomethyltransferase
VKKLSVGQVVYSAMCYDHGGMIDDGTLFNTGQKSKGKPLWGLSI